jgi:nitroreductase
MIPAIQQYYEGKDQVQRDETMRSMGILGQTIMLAAKGMGYDPCPMDGFDYDAVGKLIKLPDDHVIGFMVAVGKATEPARERGGQLLMDEIVIQNTF